MTFTQKNALTIFDSQSNEMLEGKKITKNKKQITPRKNTV